MITGRAELHFDFECDMWVATYRKPITGMFDSYLEGYGDTPQEAVAQLKHNVEQERYRG